MFKLHYLDDEGGEQSRTTSMLSQTDKEKAFSVFNLYAEGGLDDLDDMSPFTSLNNRNFTRAVAACGFKLSQQVVNNIFQILHVE